MSQRGLPMKSFVEQKITETLQIYNIDPNRINADANLENETKKSYQGREILELIQNADDEMNILESDEDKVIYISFDGDYLSVSNNGAPFDEKGVESLMLAYNSDKKRRKAKVIGNKGTGFRAVLSWAKKVVIHSGSLHIAFSHEYSQNMLKQLPAVKIDGKTSAILAFPEWIDSTPDDHTFTTEIGLIIKDDDSIRKGIIHQLEELNGEILLFLNHATTLIVNYNGVVHTFRKFMSKKCVTIEEKENDSIIGEVEWQIEKESFSYEDSTYSISIAYRNDGKKPKRSVLYCYLPTEAYFPLPVIAHANLEIDGTRNHLVKESSENAVVIDKLVAVLINTAIERTKNRRNATYEALDMLIPEKDTDSSELNHFKFWEKLADEIKHHKLLPTVNNEYISINENPIVYTEPDIANILTGPYFKKMLKDSSEWPRIKIMLLKLNERRVYAAPFFTESINKWSKNRKYSNAIVNENCRLIQALINDYFAKFESLRLLYDSDKKLSTTLFIQTDDAKLSPPDFIRLRMIDPVMEKKLLQAFDCDAAELAETLSGFNLKSFTTRELIERMQNSIKWRIEKKGNPKECINKALSWMLANYDEVVNCEIDFPVYLISRGGDIKTADKLYMGIEYKNNTTDDLFKGFEEDIFVSQYSTNMTSSELAALKQLLIKLGVSVFPRDTSITSSNDDFKRFADECFWHELEYPIQFDRFTLKQDSTNKYMKGELHTREHLDWILNNSDTGAIIRWIKNDTALRRTLETRKDAKSSVEVKFDKLIEPRKLKHEMTPSFISWKFRDAPWISVEDERYSVGDCILEDIPSDLNGVLVRPDIPLYISEDSGSKTTLRREYERLFSVIGVSRSFGELPDSRLYAMLVEMSNLLLDVKAVKPIYYKIYEDFDETEIHKPNRDFFVENGKVLCQDGMYYSPSDCFYLDRRAFCKVIKEQHHLLDMRTRLKSDKIEAVFGVKKLDVRGEVIGTPQVHPINDLFNKNFEQYKICAYCYRYGNNKAKEQNELSKFKNLKVVVCGFLEGKLNDSIIQFSNFDYITSDRETYYLRLPSTCITESDFLCHDVGEAVAGIICDMLDLSEEKTSLRDLYMKDSDDRLKAVSDESEDAEIFEKASKELGKYENNKEEFISILQTHAPDKVNTISEYSDLIDFDHFNSIANAELIIACFKACNIDVPEYNEKSIISDVHLEDYYERLVKDFKHKYFNNYKTMIYHQLKKMSIKEKLQLVDKWYDYETTTVSIDNSVDYNPEKAVIEAYSLEEYTKTSDDLIALFNSNKNAFENLVENKELLKDFYSNNGITSLIFFGEYNELKKRYGEYWEANMEPEPEDKADDGKANVSVFKGATAPKPTKKRKKVRRSAGFSQREVEKADQSKETIGFKGEYKAYNWLKEQYDEVMWVSENAKTADVNPTGSPSYGYDMSYVENGETFYVDVKADNVDSSDITIFMSKAEFDFACQNEQHYKIFYVKKAGFSDSQIMILDSVIKDGRFNEDAFFVEANVEFKLTGTITSSNTV